MKILPALIFIIVITSCSGNAQQIQPEKIKDHIKFLAGDELNGRGTGSDGEQKAAFYIEKQFKDLGLQPKGDDGTYMQNFSFNKGVHGTGEPGKSNNVVGYLDNKAKTTVIIGAHY